MKGAMLSGRAQPWRDFVLVKNIRGSAVAEGDAMCIDCDDSTDGQNGYAATIPSATNLGLYVGTAIKAIADDAYGLVQTEGYSDVTKTLGNASYGVGDKLVPTASQVYLSYSGAGDGLSGYVHALEASTSNTTTAAQKKVWLRAL